MSLEALRANLAVLKTAPLYAKAAAAEKALDSAVEVLEAMEVQIEQIIHAQIEFQYRLMNLVEKGAGDGSEKI